MTLGSTERAELVGIALRAARDASQIVLAGFRKHPVVEHKGAVDLVTSYDRASEVFLKERLAKEASFPCVGEELGGDRATAAHAPKPTWYVDPLDGTTNFVHGHPFWCVSVGLLHGDQPILGAVVAPSLALEWTGITAQAAARNGEPCRVSGVTAFEDAMLATGFPYDRRTSPENNFDAFVAAKRRVQAVRRCGAAAIDLCLVADGTYDGYWERKLNPWDLAAGAAAVLGAGGKISSFDGGPADLASGYLVATNGGVHDALVELLRSLGA
jgi:myo-inositol-1(or 4)-monophosphatase